MSLKFRRVTSALLSGAIALCSTMGPSAQAQPNGAHAASASSAISLMPVASVVGSASVAAGAVIAIPAMLLVSGGIVILRAVEVSARGTVYVLEHASDGTRVSVEVLGVSAVGASVVAGAQVATSVIATGVILSVAGEVIAFLPNEAGRALLHNERLTW